jgi:hypothetical protein
MKPEIFLEMLPAGPVSGNEEASGIFTPLDKIEVPT